MARLIVAFLLSVLLTAAAAAQSIGGNKVSQMPFASTPLDGSELLYIIQGGVSRKVNSSALFASINNFTSTTPFLAIGGTTTASDAQRWGHNLNLIDDFGFVADGDTSTASWTAGSNIISGTTAVKNQTIGMLGAGPNGFPFKTTINANGTMASNPSFSAGTWYGGPGEICPVAGFYTDYFTPPNYTNMGTGVVPGDTFTLHTGMTADTICKTIVTGVGTATIVSPGANTLTATQCVIFGTTGTSFGGRWQGLVSVDGATHQITGTITIYYTGQYTVNPPNVNSDPANSLTTGCGDLNTTPPTIRVTMGVRQARITQPGNASSQPAATQSPTSTSGSGTGVVFAIPYSQTNVAWWGTDNMPKLPAIGALSGTITAPCGVYMLSAPQNSGQRTNFTKSFELHGGASCTTFRLFPGETMPNGAVVFVTGSQSNFGFFDVNFDSNYSQVSNYVPAATIAWIDDNRVTNGSNSHYERLSFLNMMGGWIGAFGFLANNAVFTGLYINDINCTEITVDGTPSHCVYFGASGISGGKWKSVSAHGIHAIGTQFSIFSADGGDVYDFEVCCQGYGPVGIGVDGNIRAATNFNVHDGYTHDTVGFGDLYDGDNLPGLETWGSYNNIHDMHFKNTGGGAILNCGVKNSIHNNKALDVGANGNYIPGISTRFERQAAYQIQRVIAFGCDSNGTSVWDNSATDSYTFNANQGLSTAGLTPVTQYGLGFVGYTGPCAVASVPILTGGSGYTTPTATFSGGSDNGTQSLATITVGTGVVTGVVVTNIGVNYRGVPTFNFVDRGGTGATFGTPTMSGDCAPINTQVKIGHNSFEDTVQGALGVPTVGLTSQFGSMDAFTTENAGDYMLYSAAPSNVAPGTTVYSAGGNNVSTSFLVSDHLEKAGYVRGLWARMNANPATAGVTVNVLVSNTADPTAGLPNTIRLTCTIAPGQRECTDNTDVFYQPGNYYMLIQIVSASTANTNNMQIHYRLSTTN